MRAFWRRLLNQLGSPGTAFSRQLPLTLPILFALNVLLDAFGATDVPVTWQLTGSELGIGQIELDGSTHQFLIDPGIDGIRFGLTAPGDHEIATDGSDRLNSDTYDPLHAALVAESFYGRLTGLLREDGRQSKWGEISIDDRSAPMSVQRRESATPERWLSLPPNFRVYANLHAFEMPVSMELGRGGQPTRRIELDRNNRRLRVLDLTAPEPDHVLESWFFPEQVAPFAGNLLHLLARVSLAATAFLATSVAAGWVLRLALAPGDHVVSHASGQEVARNDARESSLRHISGQRPDALQRNRFHLEALPASMLLLLAFALAALFSRNVMQGEPHVFDADSLVFQAKIFASGHLAAPLPADAQIFDVPFMVRRAGHWFSQYPPGGALLLVPFVLIQQAWLAAPFFEIGILIPAYLSARRIFGTPSAVLVLVLGTLSPFLLLVTSSFLGHPASMLTLAWAFYAFVRFEAEESIPWLCAGWVFVGLSLLTRELATVLFAIPLLISVYGRLALRRRSQLIPTIFCGVVILTISAAIYLGYNQAQTGEFWITPRSAFSGVDHPGFGDGIGFHQRHTPAAGLVNTEQNLDSLAINLFGWPFPFALALPILPFLAGRAQRWDFVAGGIVLLFLAGYATYFYHGIIFGPRYLSECLLPLLFLTARGIWIAGEIAVASLRRAGLTRPEVAQFAPVAIAGLFTMCTIVYFIPRQFQHFSGYSGVPFAGAIETDALAQIPAGTVAFTQDWWLFHAMLAHRNCPTLDCEIVYALVQNAVQGAQLRALYPNRNEVEVVREAHRLALRTLSP